MKTGDFIIPIGFIVYLISEAGGIEPPTGLRVFAISPSAFRVKWLENYRNPKRSTLYTLRYRNLASDDKFRYVNTTKGEVKKLNVVSLNGSYEFAVKAIRGRKESIWSEPIKESLESAIPVGSPRGLKVKDSSPTEIKLKWRRPKAKKHSISGYRLTWKMLGTRISDVKQTNLRTHVLKNLKPGTTYIIKVQSMADDGKLSEPAKISYRTRRTLVIPPPTNFTVDVYGSTKLLVQWSIPKGADLKKITGFQIQYRQKGVHKGTLCTVVTTKKKLKYVITDLYKGEQYKVRMAAKSGHFTGKSTGWILATLPGNDSGNKRNKIIKETETEEEIKTDIKVDTVSLNDIIKIDINHTDYTFEGQKATISCIVQYKGKGQRTILWSKGDDLKAERIGAWFLDISGRHSFEEYVIDSGNGSTTISKLTLYKLRSSDSGLYTCHVINTDQSASLNLMVTDASPGPPENLNAELLSRNSIGLYWSPPKNSAIFPVTYEVHCWRRRNLWEYGYKHFVAKNIKATQFVVKSLKYNTKYFIGVVAVNKYGRSNISRFDNITITTPDYESLKIAYIGIVNPAVYANCGNKDKVQTDTPVEETSQISFFRTDYCSGEPTGLAVMVNISWDVAVVDSWPASPIQHIIHYKTGDNSTVHHLSVWKNSTIIYNLEDDKIYYFRLETVLPGRSIYSTWKKFSTFLTEVSPPPPPKDMFLVIMSNNSLHITWLPPPQEYRVRVRHYQLSVEEEDGNKRFFRVDGKIREHVVQMIDRSKRQTVELTALNDVGESDKVVRILDPFSDMSNGIHLFADPLSSTSAKIWWTTSQSSDLTRYLLRYRPVKFNSSQPVDVFVKSSVFQYIIRDLQQFTEYMVSLIPYFNDLPGNLTSVTVLTYSDVPSAPPKNINVQNNNTNFLISWEPPPNHTQNGELTFYQLEYKTKPDRAPKSMLVPASQTEVLLSGLEEGLVYLMRVAAVTINGTGPFSSWVQMVIAKTGAVINKPPEPPYNLTTEPIPNGIDLSWSSPQNSSIPILGYIVGHGRFLPEVYRTIVGSEDYQYTLTGLRPNTQYILTVRSFNKFGESKAAYLKAKTGSRQQSQTEATTAEPTTPVTTPVPGAPYDIKIKELGEEVPTALITWKRPNIKEMIKGYILLYTNDSSLPLYQWTGVFERSLQYVIKNLSFNMTYFLKIQSQTSDGTGVMSETKFFTTRSVDTTKGTLPMPKILSAFSGADYIQITWKPPDYAPIIRGYILGYGIQQPGEYQEMLPFSETTFKIQKLAAETLYHISLRSFGEFGESEKAVISVSTTA